MPRKTIEQEVRSQIIGAIKYDLDGAESLMKEVWEQCATDAAFERAKRECRRVIAAIEALGEES